MVIALLATLAIAGIIWLRLHSGQRGSDCRKTPAKACKGCSIAAACKKAAPAALLLAALTAAAQDPPLRLHYFRPAAFMEESLPIGNGRSGALVYGGADTDTLYLNDITLWTGKPMDPQLDSDAHLHLPAVREALFRGDYLAADSLQRHLMGPNSQYYQPLATLAITDLNAGAYTGYHRTLSLDSALLTDTYRRGTTTYTRTCLASAPDSLIAMRLTADGPEPIRITVRLTSQLPHSVKAHAAQITLTGHALGPDTATIHFAAMLRAEVDSGTVEAADTALTITARREAVIYFVDATSFNGALRHPVSQGAPYLERAADRLWHTANTTFADIRRRHTSDYRRLFTRFSINLCHTTEADPRPTDQMLRDYTDLGEANPYLEMLYAQYGRYLLISSSRTDGAPANLQGLWADKLHSPWRGNYTMNINLQENYWPACPTGLEECVRPLDGFITALAANGSHTARSYYGIDKGWCASHNSDIWASTNPVGEKREKPQWACFNLAGAWLVETLYDRFFFTRDTAALSRTAYPLMKGAAEFCLRWLIPDPADKRQLITAPSTTPENTVMLPQGSVGFSPRTSAAQSTPHYTDTSIATTSDLAIIRELLINTAAAADALHRDRKFAKTLRKALARLWPYRIGSKGQLQEWYNDWQDADPHHRHQSHLIGVYPGLQPMAPELLKAASRSLDLRGEHTTG